MNPSQSPGYATLAHLYLDRKLTYRQIATLYGVHNKTVGDWLRAEGIPARDSRAQKSQRRRPPDEEASGTST